MLMIYICSLKSQKQIMQTDSVLLATFIYPHEAIFIESALVSKGIHYLIQFHSPLLRNTFYANQEQVKSIYIAKKDIKAALAFIRSIAPDNHLKNRYTLLCTNELDANLKPSNSEKGICASCYFFMFSTLGVVAYTIFKSIQCLF